MDQLSERLAEVAAGTAENVVVGDGAGHLMNDTHDQENRDPNVSQQVLGGQVHHQPGPAAPSPIDIPTTTPSRRRARIPSTASSSLQSEDQVLMNQENITPPHRIIHTNNNNNNDNPPPIPRRRQRRRVVLGELDLEQPNSSPDSHSPTPLHRPLIRAHATHHLPLNRQLFNSPAVRRVVDWDMELAASELDHAASESESEEDGVTMVDEEEAMSLLSHQDSFAHSFGDHEDDEDVDERDLISFAELELQDREISHWPPTSHAIAFPLSSSPSSEESSVASSIGSHGVATNSSSGGEEEYQIIDDDEDERDDYMYDQLHDTVDGDEKTLVNSISPSFSVPRK